MNRPPPARRRASPRRLGISMVAALAGLSLLASATVIQATNFGSEGTAGSSGTTNGVWLQVNGTWTVAKVYIDNSSVAAGVDYALTYQYGPTDLGVYGASTTSCASYDTCVYDSYYGANGFYGWNQCAGTTSGSHPSQTCSQTHIKINLSYTPGSWFWLTCHEMGHSVGLRHTSDTSSCLFTPNGSSSSLTSHDVSHLNGQY